MPTSIARKAVNAWDSVRLRMAAIDRSSAVLKGRDDLDPIGPLFKHKRGQVDRSIGERDQIAALARYPDDPVERAGEIDCAFGAVEVDAVHLAQIARGQRLYLGLHSNRRRIGRNRLAVGRNGVAGAELNRDINQWIYRGD